MQFNFILLGFLLSMTFYRIKMNHREVIDKSIAALVESIDVKNTTLWERLIELGLFTSGDVEYIKVSIIPEVSIKK